MKIVFAGPSLHGAQFDAGDVVIEGPAQMGDVERAMNAGATIIGIVDGHYQQVGAVWHKEILYALSHGVAVYGASSMGALRAAECSAFGMVPVGEIAHAYCSGVRFDDADVALTNGPAELGFPPLTEPMVDVEATVTHLGALGLVSGATAGRIVETARAIFFADRTVEAIFAQLDPAWLALYSRHRVSQKTIDAVMLIETLKALRAGKRAPVPEWTFSSTPFWAGRATPRPASVTPL